MVSASALAAASLLSASAWPELLLFAPGFSLFPDFAYVCNGDFCFHSVFNRLFISVRKTIFSIWTPSITTGPTTALRIHFADPEPVLYDPVPR